MLVTLGDLVTDVVVRLDGAVNVASDTPAEIEQRRGGSAANVAAISGRLGRAVRFIGQVGDDPIGAALVAELATAGVDTTAVRRAGRTGSVVVLVDHLGERTMLADRATCIDLDGADRSWLTGADTLHVPLYSLVDPPLSETALTTIGWAHEQAIAVSVDASSTAVIEAVGVEAVREILDRIGPTVLFANEDEAGVLGLVQSPVGGLIVIKHGPRPAVVARPGRAAVEVPAVSIDRTPDTTGAGDAFAAGFLAFADQAPGREPAWLADPVAACEAGHRAAAELIAAR